MGLADLSNTLNRQKDRAAGGGGGGYSGGGNNLPPLKYTPKLKMRDGETITVRFNGGPDEPRILLFHSIRKPNSESYDSALCGIPFMEPRSGQKPGDIRGSFVHVMKEPHAGCVFCAEKKAGNKAVGGASEKAVLAVLKCELIHKVPNEQGTKNRDGEVYVNDRACTFDDQGYCDHCDNKEVITWGEFKGTPVSERRYAGQFKWELAMAGAGALWGQYTELRKWCASCWPSGSAVGVGKIRTTKYTCDACGADISPREYDPTKKVYHTCSQCQNYSIPIETCVCSNGCEDARRTSIWDGNWRITRVGSSTNTTYTLVFMGVSEMEPWMFEMTPPDFDKEERPMSAAKMAERLGVPNPFQGQQVSSSSSGGARMVRPNSPPPVRSGPAPAITGPRAAVQPPRTQNVIVPPGHANPDSRGTVVRQAVPPPRQVVQTRPAARPSVAISYEEASVMPDDDYGDRFGHDGEDVPL